MRAMLTAAFVVALAGPLAAQAPRPQSTAPNATSPQDTSALPPQEIGTITVGSSRNGLLEIGDYTMGDATWADVWYVNATAGQRFTIELRSRAFDPYVQLLDPWGGKLAEDDDSGDGNASRLVFTAREAGRYQIVVNCSGDEPRTGAYSLSVR
jgi:hypothetical protein